MISVNSLTNRLWQKAHCLFSNSTAKLWRRRKGKEFIPWQSSGCKSLFLSNNQSSHHDDTSLDKCRMADAIIREMSLTQSPHYIRISLDAILNNLSVLRSHCAPHTGIIAVVKANAYGHGSVGITNFLSQCGVDHFAVATVREGATLRFGGVKDTIIVFGNLTEESVHMTYRHRLVPVVTTVNAVDIWKSNLAHLDTRQLAQYPVVVKVDTGLTRFGCHLDDLDKIVERCFDHGIPVHSVMNHISETWFNADESLRELDRFLQATGSYREMGIKVHSSASGPTLHGMGVDLDFIRPGSALYGLPDDNNTKEDFVALGLRPALSWLARPSIVKTTRPGQRVGYFGSHVVKREGQSATFGFGYADGYTGALSNGGWVSDLHGRLFQVIGYVSMNSVVVDVSDDVTESSVFHILKDDYSSMNSVVAAAEKVGTTPQEFSSNLCYSIPRVFTLRNQAHYAINDVRQSEFLFC